MCIISYVIVYHFLHDPILWWFRKRIICVGVVDWSHVGYDNFFFPCGTVGFFHFQNCCILCKYFSCLLHFLKKPQFETIYSLPCLKLHFRLNMGCKKFNCLFNFSRDIMTIFPPFILEACQRWWFKFFFSLYIHLWLLYIYQSSSFVLPKSH